MTPSSVIHDYDEWEAQEALVRILAVIAGQCGKSWIRMLLAPSDEVSIDCSSIEAQTIMIMNSELGLVWLNHALAEIDEEQK